MGLPEMGQSTLGASVYGQDYLASICRFAALDIIPFVLIMLPNGVNLLKRGTIYEKFENEFFTWDYLR